ncbi:MAG TPA: Na+/H+ antiporter [Solirubrobacteraceae bacterium]|nr:Na+/H+ antiporter [Solirubrobacteraceae bacterium]
MSTGQLIIVLAVATVTLLAVAALRRTGMPTAAVLVVAGLVIGFLPFVPDASLEPHAVLLGLLPLLVFDAAATSSATAFVRNARSIGLLAVGLVVATALVVAAVTHWIGHLSWAMAFVLGTAVGPTDAAAATGVARRLGLPRRLLSILEGEALFNDGAALVLYATAVAAATSGHFSALNALGHVVYASLAGTAIGLAVGVVGRHLRNRIDDAPIEIAGSILIAYAAYLPAEALDASGVLAAVAAGLYLGWYSGGTALSARSRLQSGAFWETLVFLINAALFVIVGLSFHTFTAQARGPVGTLVVTGIAVVVAVIVIRLGWMEATGWMTRVLRRTRPHDEDSAPDQAGWRQRLILGWAGMRGAITLAVLLAVPVSDRAGRPLAGRDDIIYLGFAVIIVTLVGQGATLPLLVRRLGLAEHPSVAEAQRQARLELTEAVLDRLQHADGEGPVAQDLIDGLRAQYLVRRDRLRSYDDADDFEEMAEAASAERELRRELIGVQRDALARLRSEGRIGMSIARTIEHDLDLEDARLSSVG